MTWQQFLGEYLTQDRFVIAVCGTHGKTTTTAMIAKVLEDAGLDPTVELGAITPWWKSNYRIGNGKYFVVEADEFNDNFLHLKPDVIVVTNIEMDHPEYFKDLAAVKESFKKFLLQTKQTVLANLSDPNVADILKVAMKAHGHRPHDREVMAQYFDYSKNTLSFSLQIPGEFNRLNAQAASQVGLILGIDSQIIQKSLQSYTGVGRRFEYIGKYNGAQVYSDFGHHPTEIKVTMEAARQKFPNRRILLVYQPHMFSRTKALFDDFVKVFKESPVDKIIILDIYPSREVDTGLINSRQIVEAVSSGTLVYHSQENLKELLDEELKTGDILFFMGAGDIDKLVRELVSTPVS